MSGVYKEYKKLFPDAEDPTGLVVSLGMEGTDELVARAVRERKQ